MALFREFFWWLIKIVREKDKTEWMQKEDNIAGEMMQERFCAVFWFCIIHVFIQILQNFSQEEGENAKSWPQELKQICFLADHLSTFYSKRTSILYGLALKSLSSGMF